MGHAWKNQSKLIQWVTLRKKVLPKKMGRTRSPKFGLGVNPLPSRSTNRTPPLFRRANQNMAMTIIVLPRAHDRAGDSKERLQD